MKCPFCGEEMREGYVFSYKDGALSFAEELPGLFAKGEKSRGYVKLTEFKIGEKSHANACICEKCKKAIIDYTGE